MNQIDKLLFISKYVADRAIDCGSNQKAFDTIFQVATHRSFENSWWK